MNKKNMSKKIWLLALLAILSLFAGISHASVNPKLMLANHTVSEDPALPGHAVILKLQLKNIDTVNCADMVTVQISASYPLSVSGSDIQHIGRICPDNPLNGTASFNIPVDSLAMTGTYPVSVMTTYEKDFSKFSESNTINLRVSGEPSFTASVASSNPVDIYPGDGASIKITFQNNGAGRAESARVTLTAPEGIDVKWAGSSQELGTIQARGSASATFVIEAAKNAAPGIYPLNATLEYSSENKTEGLQSFSLNMPLKQKAEFGADAEKNGPFVAGENREILITLKNTGTEEARKLKVRIMPLFPFSTDGTVRYIESLAPGESKDLSYIVNVDKEGTPGDQIAGLLINFENPEGKKFSDSIDLQLSITQKGIAYYAGTYWWMIALALIVAYVAKKRGKIFKSLPKIAA